jgi:hypothetical protein
MFASNDEHQQVSKANLDRIIVRILAKIRKFYGYDTIEYKLDSKILDAKSVSLKDVCSVLRDLDYIVETKKVESLHRPVIHTLKIYW